MIRRLTLSLSALLALAGGAFSAPAAAVEVGQRIRIAVGDGEVETLVVAVKGELAPDGAKRTLMIGLHGYGMEAAQIATLVDLDANFDHLYLAPEGFHELGDGTRAWFPISWDGERASVDPGELAKFLGLFEGYALAAARLFEADRVVVIGYSQGGAAAIHLARHRPGLARAFVGLAGSILPPAPAVESDARLFIGHGTLDALVSTEAMRTDVEGLRRLGLDVTYREYAVPHVVSAAQRRDVAAWLEQQLEEELSASGP